MYWYEKEPNAMTDADWKCFEKYDSGDTHPVGKDGVVHWYNKPQNEWSAEDVVWCRFVEQCNHWVYPCEFDWMGKRYLFDEDYVLYSMDKIPLKAIVEFPTMKDAMDTPCFPDGSTLRQVFQQRKADELKWS